MIGVCFQEVEKVAVENLADPVLEASTDAIVRVELAGLCGSDLHPFFGRERGILPGTVMGHEFVGEVIAVGSEVRTISQGARVCAPFTTNCGSCHFCQIGLTSRCVSSELFGWRQSSQDDSAPSGLHGGQATMIRVPHADGTLMPIPEGVTDDVALLLGDNLSTGWFAADMAGVNSNGFYSVIGCGTVGLLAILAATQLMPERVPPDQIIAVDPCESRLEIARQLGVTTCNNPAEAQAAVMDRTQGRGVDGVMELVGLPAAQELAYRLVRPGGTLSVIGCHCTPHFAFSPADAYDKNLTYRTGRCPARSYMGRIAETVAEAAPDLSWCVTHQFPIDDAVHAYDVFSNRRDGCIKAALRM